MIKLIKTKNVDGNLLMISSKSLFHRYLIMASRIENFSIKFNALCDDVKTTIEVLRAIGSKIEIKDREIIIKGFKKIEENKLNFNESGSSLRFLMPYAFIEKGNYQFRGKKRLPYRPISDLIDVLENKDVFFTSKRLPFRASGKIEGAFFKLNASLSSQYISALMMSGSFISDEIEIQISSDISSLSYIKMTAEVMKDFSFATTIKKEKIKVKKINKKQSKKSIQIEGDWSNALVPIALATLRGKVIIKGLNKNSYQGDINLIHVLENAGADIKWCNNDLIVRKSIISPLEVDLSDNIDSFPVLSVLALSCKGNSVFRNINRLRLKESDRIEAILDLHRSLGAKSYVQDNNFIVVPDRFNSFEIDSYKDHRIVMAAVVASALADIEVRIKNFEAIDKSYPGFENDMKAIGVNIGDLNEI